MAPFFITNEPAYVGSLTNRLTGRAACKCKTFVSSKGLLRPQRIVPKVKVVLIPLMAKKTAPQIWTEYALTRGFVSAFGLLPRKASIALGKAFGRRTSRLFAKLSRVGLRNLELAFPDKPLAVREQLLERAFENLGRVLGTVAHFGDLTIENFSDLIVYEPEPEFDAAYKRSIE